MMYATPAADEPLTQGDILDACPIFGLDVTAGGADPDASPARWRERVVVLTQACDLAQTKMTKVLVALLHPAQMLVERGILKAPTIRDAVRRGTVYGWYFLPAAPAPIPWRNRSSIFTTCTPSREPSSTASSPTGDASAGCCCRTASTWRSTSRSRTCRSVCRRRMRRSGDSGLDAAC
jgi:hypothetical protein